jgi:hypothetical protein
MAIRTSMQDLFRKVRRYIGDPYSTTMIWTDQEVQDTLDRYRTEVRYGLLRPTPDLMPGGVFQYLVYQAPVEDWEANEVIMNSSFNPLTPAVSDRNVGRWTLAASTYPPVYIKGFYYDLNAAAVELLEARMAQLAGAYDFSPPGGGSFKRSQLFDHMQVLMDACYARMRPGKAIQMRSDVQLPNESLDTVFGTNGIEIW